MKFDLSEIHSLESRFGSPLYVFDEGSFIENFRHLQDAMRKCYPNYQISYSYKTNYTPYICKLVKSLGGYAEVVSGMEYGIAKKIGYDDSHIIFNGPDKGPEAIEAFHRGCMVNADSLLELQRYCKIAKETTAQRFTVGLRLNLDLGQNFVSRFGMDEEDLKKAIKMIDGIPNLSVAGIHCHISRCRGKDAWRARTEWMLRISEQYFNDDLSYIDLGSGMFGSMSSDFAKQFSDVPTYEEYASVTAALFTNHFKGKKQPIFFTEPGTTLVNRFISLIGRVETIKNIHGHAFAVLNCSEHNLGETCLLKKLPVEVIPGGNPQAAFETLSMVGYTCLEQDVLYPDYNGKLAEGDYVVFENVGGYSNVLKPPFIRPNCAMAAKKEDGTFEWMKSAETFEDLLHTYRF